MNWVSWVLFHLSFAYSQEFPACLQKSGEGKWVYVRTDNQVTAKSASYSDSSTIEIENLGYAYYGDTLIIDQRYNESGVAAAGWYSGSVSTPSRYNSHIQFERKRDIQLKIKGDFVSIRIDSDWTQTDTASIRRIDHPYFQDSAQFSRDMSADNRSIVEDYSNLFSFNNPECEGCGSVFFGEKALSLSRYSDSIDYWSIGRHFSINDTMQCVENIGILNRKRQQIIHQEQTTTQGYTLITYNGASPSPIPVGLRKRAAGYRKYPEALRWKLENLLGRGRLGN